MPDFRDVPLNQERGSCSCMAVTLGSNLFALRALRSLGDSSNALSRSFERLSSGSRINRASDDPAGLSAASILNSKSRILTRAKQNLSDGTSLLNIADGALGEVSSLLQRMTELAEQAANGTFSTTQRKSLDQEFQQLDQEIRRIGSTTTFNGISLLNGQKSTKATRITASDAVTNFIGSGGISTDGRYTSRYESIDGGTTFSVLIVTDSVTGNERRFNDISDGSGDAAPIILNNGDAIWKSATGGVYRFSFESGQQTKIAESASAVAASADGSTLALYSNAWYQDGGTTASYTVGGYGRVYSLNLETGTVRELTHSSLNETLFFGLSVSADGSYVGFSAFTLAGFSSNSYTADTRGSGVINPRSTSNSGVAIPVGVTNDGKYFYKLSNTLVSLDANSGATRTVVSNFAVLGTGTQRTMRMSSDGQYVYFASSANLSGENSRLKKQIFKLDVGTGQYTQLTNFTTQLDNVSLDTISLSADGSRLQADDLDGNIIDLDITPDNSSMDFEAGYGTQGGIIASLQGLFSAVRGLGALKLTSLIASRQALDRMTLNITSLNTARGVIGASLSRLESGYRISDAMVENDKAAESRIRDVDVANESANLVKQSILQQVGASLLAQANQQPTIALQLLR